MDQHYPFPVTPLPYSYVALMPGCDADTLYYHYNHYVLAVQKCNQILRETGLTKLSLYQILLDQLPLPPAGENKLKNLAGEILNHSLYFRGLYSPLSRLPDNTLTRAISKTYGSPEKFLQIATQAAESIRGSGWVWLILENKELHLSTTQDNQVPNLAAVSPVLCVDLWEHAYWSLHQFDRKSYMQAWFSMINWERADELFRTGNA